MFLSQPISLLNIVISISSAIDLIDPTVADHHTTVAYIANQLARELGLSQHVQYEVALAGLLHDIGMLSGVSQKRILCMDNSGVSRHYSEVGYQLLKKFRHFGSVADIVRDHHKVQCARHGKQAAVSQEVYILCLADQVDTLIDKNQPILEQVDNIVANIACCSGNVFPPAHIDAFTELAWKEHFWLDIASPSLQSVLRNNCSSYSIDLNGDDLVDFAELFAHVIDFRCRFTATHSSGVATVASILANLVGFSAAECQKMQVAGYLHDIGKLAVPQEYLEKRGSLTTSEYRLVKSHAYHTNRILESLHGLGEIRIWASMHHERPDGFGYPNRCKAHNIPLGARIMAVADTFTALMESRPYRDCMTKSAAIENLTGMANCGALDKRIVDVLVQNFDDINTYRQISQDEAREEYARFISSIGGMAHNVVRLIPQMAVGDIV